MRNLIVFLVFILGSFSLHAETIEFTEDELPTETVLPVFDKTSVVKGRIISQKKRFEVGAGLGLNMTEALYDNLIYNVSAAYHFDEVHGLNVHATFMNDGLSSMGQDLKDGKVQGGALDFDASRAPTAEYSLFANYQATAYYGKISVTKQAVVNLTLYGQAGIGTVSFGDTNSLGFNVGFGQKVYFTKDLALRFDLRMLMYNGPDPTSPKDSAETPNRQLRTGGAKLDSDDFDETTFFHSHLTLGLVYLL